MLIINRYQYAIVTLDIIYWMPGYSNIVQEFVWQTQDLKPNYPRINKFLYFWKNEINAVIKEVHLIDSTGSSLRNVFEIGDIGTDGNTRFN
jgi:uncharacterized protein Usg